MMIARPALGVLLGVMTTRAATFWCDPIHGSPEGDGSSARPWRTIHEVIKNVFVNARDGDDNHDDGIQLGQKKNQAAGNTVRNNFAHSFDFKADAAVQAENNQEVTEAVFKQRLAELARDIDQRFGEGHPTAKRPRLESTPARTSLSDPTLRFAPSPKPYVVLRCGPLTAVVVDNQAVDDEVLPGHRAGYLHFFWASYIDRPESPGHSLPGPSGNRRGGTSHLGARGHASAWRTIDAPRHR
jgi:hypothetical protein